MSDLISRQDVFDEILRISGHLDTDMLTRLYVELKMLPSVQPEQPIRCGECKHYNAGFECLIEGYGIERNKNWFCADAERRTDAD